MILSSEGCLQKSMSNNNFSILDFPTLSFLSSQTRQNWPANITSNASLVEDVSSSIINAQQYDWKIRSRDRPIVELEDRALWTEFYQNTTEMVITKTGRRMFPAFKVRIKGLDPTAKYVMLLDTVLANENRYKYYHNQWIKSGKAELNHNSSTIPGSTNVSRLGLHHPLQQHHHGLYVHPDSPNSGEEWMNKPISFHKIKLSNTRVDKDDVIILNSMHKYIPKLYLVRCQNVQHVNYCHWSEYSFEETQFIAVTAYQNDQITKLKINYNPFAKGFRESSSLKKVKRVFSELENSSIDVHQKSMSSALVNNFMMMRNKYFKQFAMRNKNFNSSFQLLNNHCLFDDRSDLPINHQNETKDSKSDVKRFKQGFLVTDLID